MAYSGLKIPRPLKPCRFDSGPGYTSNALIHSYIRISYNSNYSVATDGHLRQITPSHAIFFDTILMLQGTFYDALLVTKICSVIICIPHPFNVHNRYYNSTDTKT